MSLLFKKYKKLTGSLLVFIVVSNFALGGLLTPRVANAGLSGAVTGALVGGIACTGIAIVTGGIGALPCAAIVLGGAGIGAAPDTIGWAAAKGTEITVGLLLYSIFWVIFHIVLILFSVVSAFLQFFISLGLTSGPLNGEAIRAGWIVVRDISNIFFVFILLYISITTIIGKNGPNTYKLLGQVIAAALLINFSLAIGRTVIDSSNILANEFWQKINSEESSFTSKIADAAQLTNIGQKIDSKIKDEASLSHLSQALMYGAMSFFMLLAVVILLFGAFLFLLRFVSLAIILVLAPVAFIGSIIPQTEPYAKEWWQKLFSQAFLAPAFLFFMYLAIYILSSRIIADPTNVTVDLASAIVALINGKATEQPEVMIIFMKFALAMGFMAGAATAAQRLGGATAKLATVATGAALGLGAAGVAGAGQATVGRVAAKVAKTYEGETTGIKGAIAGSADYLSKSSFDFRNLKVPEAVPVVGGAAIGKKITSGIAMATEVKIEPGVETSFVQEEQKAAEQKKKKEMEQQKVAERIQNQSDLEAANAMPSATPADQAAKNTRLQEVLKRFSPDDIVKMKSEILADVNGMLANLDAKGVKALEEKGELTAAEKTSMRTAIEANASNLSGNKAYKDVRTEEKEARTRAAAATLNTDLRTAVAANDYARINALVSAAAPEVVTELDPTILTNTFVARNLSEDHLEELVKAGKGKLASSQRRAIKTAVMSNAANVNGQNYLNSGPGKKFWG